MCRGGDDGVSFSETLLTTSSSDAIFDRGEAALGIADRGEAALGIADRGGMRGMNTGTGTNTTFGAPGSENGNRGGGGTEKTIGGVSEFSEGVSSELSKGLSELSEGVSSIRSSSSRSNAA